MKKTISINMRGYVFNIDDDAYEVLNKYLNEINNHYKNTPGFEDIINDIENRIAELFQLKMTGNKQVITLIDVSEVIKILGHPSDFDRELEEDQASGYAYSGRGTKRLFRDPENRVVGGVCSGLGYYFNIDPVWIRLLFVFGVVFAGTGPLIYLILWIVLPPARSLTDRLEMQGDPINISNIEKAVKEEMADVKDKLGDFAKQAKDTFKNKR